MNTWGKELIKSSLVLASMVLLSACTESTEVDQEAAAISTPQELESSSSQPNVLFILVDDLGFGDVGYNGSEIATPNLDQMALDGMLLDRNYVYPVCSPTRAALLSGQNPLHMGITGPIDDNASLPPDLKIMPGYFKDLGYQTHMIGKWHLGLSETSAWPTTKGFDSYYGFLGGWIDFYTHVFAGGLDWQRDGVSVREEGHATDLMTEEAIRIIEQRTGQPFFMWLSYNAPHSPLQHPPVYSELNDYPEISDRSVYAEMVTHVDDGIGRVLDSLKEQGILEETLVIFSSDNGGAPGFGASNGDLRGGKRLSLEGGMRVPGLILWAGTIDSGSVLEQAIAVHDWLPTLLEAVGGDPEAVIDPYGQSMWAAIADGVEVERDTIVMGAVGNLGVYEWPWKLVAVESAESGQSYSLFNVVDDPTEQRDLAAGNPEMLARLIAEIEAMPEPEINRLEPEFNNSPRYYPSDVPTYDARHLESKKPWAESAAR
jgi:arylsulfatase A-like enzyme